MWCRSRDSNPGLLFPLRMTLVVNQRKLKLQISGGKDTSSLLQPQSTSTRGVNARRPALGRRDRSARAGLRKPGDVIFEGAQGVLLDEWHGFHPYTTWSTTTFANAMALLRETAPVKIGRA